MHNKRLIIATEPLNDAKFNTSFINKLLEEQKLMHKSIIQMKLKLICMEQL